MEPLKTINRLKNLKNAQVIRNLRGLQGVQAFTTVFLGLLTSFGIIALLSGVFFNNSAYAASYINVSSGSGGTISFDSIKPSSAGVSASASDTLTITTNCSAGYKVYVSGQENGDTNLTNSSASSNNTISASSTTVGSAATTLNSNTWGITGDSASASASKYVGLPAYANATDAALITVPSASTSGDNKNTIYYGVKVDTSLSPGTYAGDVLYTVLMNNACLEYTLKFDDNGATTSNLSDKTISFGRAVDLSEYSTTDKISKTGYHLSGWKIKDGDGTLLPTNTNTSLDDGESSEITLIAEWKANTYTITYNANVPTGTTVTGNTGNQTNQVYGSTTTLQANGFTIDGYEFKGWAYQSTATEENFNESQANVSVSALAENNASGSVVNTNGGTITLYAVWEKVTPYMQDVSASDLTESATTTLRDSRDNQDYTVYRWSSSGTASTDYPTGMAGYAIMTKDLSLGYVTGGSIEKGSNLVLSTDDSAGSTTSSAPIYNRTSTSNWSSTNSDSNLQYINGPSATGNTYSAHSYYSYGAAQIVCPKGWRPPTNDEYGNITTFMGGNNATGSSKVRSTPYNFIYNGNFPATGWYYVGNRGYYWSSTQSSDVNGYGFFIASDELNSATPPKNNGRSVRCVSEYVPDCSETVHPTTTTGCKMKDDNIWIYGNDGDATTWASSYTCPTGYSSPNNEVFFSLMSAQGSGSQLYSVLGISGDRSFWSIDYTDRYNAYYLYVGSSSAKVGDGASKASSLYILCYKPS